MYYGDRKITPLVDHNQLAEGMPPNADKKSTIEVIDDNKDDFCYFMILTMHPSVGVDAGSRTSLGRAVYLALDDCTNDYRYRHYNPFVVTADAYYHH